MSTGMSSSAETPVSGALERFFKLKQNKTDIRTELLAGVTTFVTLAYVLFVYPNILKDAGMPVNSTFVATCVASAFATLLMGLYANYPIAVAPGMGLGAYFTYTVCAGMGLPWQTALGAVFISGVVFFLLTVTRVREWIVDGAAGPAFRHRGGDRTFYRLHRPAQRGHCGQKRRYPGNALGNMRDPGVLVAIAGLVITSLLMSRRVKGAFLIGILITTVVAVASGVSPAPQGIGSLIMLANPSPPSSRRFQLDIAGALKAGLISILFSFTFVDMFDNIGTLIGVSRRAGLLDEQGQLPRIGKALFADSLGTIFGSLTGTSTVTSYIESAAGVSEGGRTGLAAVVIALLFLVAVIFAPLVALIPVQATAPVLIIVGLLMMGEVVNIRFDDFTEALPAFLTIIMMPLTYSIAQGLAFGFMSYTIIKLLSGRHRENNAVTYTLTVLFILHFMLG